MTKSKLEKVLEHVVNGESDLANELLHEHLIEAAREIYADLAEEDELAETELELDENDDEDEDLDEGFSDADSSDDFEDDIDTINDEIETEEYFGENGDEEDEAMDDLEGEMDLDDEGEFDGDDDLDMEFDDEGEADGDVEDAMVNVEDAMAELKAAFAELVGDEVEDDMGDEVADEFDDDEEGEEDDYFDDEEDEEEFGESATLSKVSTTMAGDEDGKSSPIKQNQPNISDKGKAVDFAGGDEKGGKASAPKKMSVTGPQEQKGKMNNKVSAPKNSSEKAKSNIGS